MLGKVKQKIYIFALSLKAAPVLKLTTLGLKRAWQGTEDELTSNNVTNDNPTRLNITLNA